MTAATDLHPDPGHPVLAGAAEIEACLDRMLTGAATAVAGGQYAELVQVLERLGRRLEAVRLKVLAAADRAGTAQEAGFTGTDAWVARQTRTPRARAAREVRLATDLGEGHDATAVALDEGLLSPAHAAVIVDATRQLPSTVTPEQRETVEAALVAKARLLNPDQLRRTARRALEAVEPDPQVVDAHEDNLLRTEEEQAHAKASLTFHDNGDGTVSGHFTVPALAAGMLRKVIEAMTAPRRMREGVVSTGSTTGPGSTTGLGSTTVPGSFDWRHRRGLAFAELLEHLPTDHLHTRSTATVVVTIDHTVLHGALQAARLDTGETLSAGEARRLACGAGILPAVLGSGSVALDLGREARLFSRHQALALGLRHDTCAAEGCERPYAWCELHHRDPWSSGGRTDLADAVPLCHHHHQRIHDETYHHRHLPDGTLRFSRRT
jgi:hypothetical protein